MSTIAASTPPEFLKVLAHDVRWQLLSALAYTDCRVQELVELVGRPMNLISYHLGVLRRHALVNERRSSADGRDVYYSLDLDRLQALFQESGARLHPLLGPAAPAAQAAAMPAVARVLFLCTHNSARSQMAEALLRQLGGPRVEVFSAGTRPGRVHPLAISTLAATGIDISGQRSKHLDEFRGQHFTYIITVCDRVREECPVFPGDPAQIHWSIPDPVEVQDSGEEQQQAFKETARQLSTRLRHFLPVLDRRGRRHAASIDLTIT
ncbi:MAG: metalloregulator ArsR/SmtB family transcription factor [Caldilineaceae bacterium]|nr:metalloregulator ArsR/SmtB family transcription factor [Caldilineaceae bacterium]